MPSYEYACDANRTVVEVTHEADVTLRTWGELCYLTGISPGRTDPGSPVRRVLRSAPAVSKTVSDSELREAGFTKLVRRDDGVYENVTASGDEERYMRRGRDETMPHLRKKIRD
ncbi:MAG TPA: zinc ribbon domain-containing protein [Gammaproteobacteria bacterium]